jgi:HSP20 family molecular chaperone IbpA
MVNDESTVALSGQSISDVPNGEPTMSNSEATRQVQEAAELANKSALGIIPGQVNRKQQQRPMPRQQGPVAQYNSYQQPPVNNVQRVAPAQMVAQPLPQQTVPTQQPQYYQHPQYCQQPQPLPNTGYYYQQPQQQQMPMAPMVPMAPIPSIPQAPQMSDGFGAPFSEMYVTSDQVYECFIDLPGVARNDLKVRVVHNSLEVSGVRKLHSESPASGKKKRIKVLAAQSSVPAYLLNHFKFTFPFAKPVDEDNVKADLENGQLHVTINILSSEKGVNVSIGI